MMKNNPAEVLDDFYKEATETVASPFIEDATVLNMTEAICRCNANKAPIRFLMSCLLAKICHPEVDIRKPYTGIEGEDSYSGRLYDETYIEPFIHKYELPCNPTTAYLTPAFRNMNRLLTPDLVLEGRPKEVYANTLLLLDKVHSSLFAPDALLKEILRWLLVIKTEDKQRMEQLLAELKPTDTLPLSVEEIVTLLRQHLACKHSSRLPVLIVAAAYQTVKGCIGEVNKPLEAHNAADKQTGAIGDIEIVLNDEDKVITCYEMKDKRILKTDIDVALQKLSEHTPKIDNYIFITTDVIDAEVEEYAKSLYEKIGVEFAILDCIGFIKHFLHFFHRYRGAFLSNYQEMVVAESNSAVPQPLKEAFLALRRVAEGDRRI
ncbi:MAG: restriction endonuclease, SacI family [Prevotellaceae bacterium]|jgi:DNA adenine methylase|nr:restriction endonuclease, SacI family [Prevotellaceae bacterium]